MISRMIDVKRLYYLMWLWFAICFCFYLFFHYALVNQTQHDIFVNKIMTGDGAEIVLRCN